MNMLDLDIMGILNRVFVAFMMTAELKLQIVEEKLCLERKALSPFLS